MHSSVRLSVIVLILAWLAAGIGCQTISPKEQAALEMVPVTDPSQVAGKWEGLLRRVPPSRTDGVTLVILSDGRYRFTSARTIGILRGEGTFTVADGRLTTTGERGTMDVTLFEGEGRRMLRATGQSSDGLGFVAEVTPVKSPAH
ncbi:MAG TPA: hypothetical protein VLE46_15235 [Nitrospira sp.]|nr:hypothetical protein [Nitrospira sp.]